MFCTCAKINGHPSCSLFTYLLYYLSYIEQYGKLKATLYKLGYATSRQIIS